MFSQAAGTMKYSPFLIVMPAISPAHFTAHFEKDPNYVDPDGSDKVTPANGSKLMPKTGDGMPGATAAAVLGAGVLLLAGTKLACRRCQ